MKYGLYSKNNLEECITTCSFNEWCSYEFPVEKAVNIFHRRKGLPIEEFNKIFVVREIK